MKLVLDSTSLCRRQTGMENYALNLSRALLETAGQNEYHLLFRQNVPPELASYSNRACFCLSPFNNQIAAEQLWIPFMERKLTPRGKAFRTGWKNSGAMYPCRKN